MIITQLKWHYPLRLALLWLLCDVWQIFFLLMVLHLLVPNFLSAKCFCTDCTQDIRPNSTSCILINWWHNACMWVSLCCLQSCNKLGKTRFVYFWREWNSSTWRSHYRKQKTLVKDFHHNKPNLSIIFANYML